MGYGWGDDTGESRGFRSGGGADYKSPRDAYEEPPKSRSRSRGASEDRSRSYRGGKTEAPVGKDLISESTHPLVVITDVTGSMNEWPGIIFEKLPLLGDEVKRYAPDYVISFAAVGDARCDRYPLQVRDFAAGKPLDEHINMLFPEGGGGDNPESYGVAAYYYVNHCQIDKAVKPILIFILDAPYHEKVLKSEIMKCTGDDAQSVDTKAVFRQLMTKFTVYIVYRGHIDDSSAELWKSLVGAQQVVPISEPRDVVEILIGIYDAEMGEAA